MRVEPFLVIPCILGMAIGSTRCASNGLPVPSKDAATPDLGGSGGPDAGSDAIAPPSKDAATPDLGGSGGPDAGSDAVALPSKDAATPDLGGSGGLDAVRYVIPPSDSGTSPIQACLSPIVASCPAGDVRYYFNPDVGKCVQTQGCTATGNTFATVAECEAACIRVLNCSCTVGAGPCDSQGLCGTCPSPNLLANLTDTASGLACVNPGLICHITTADTLLWRCDCVTWSDSTTWKCGIPVSG